MSFSHVKVVCQVQRQSFALGNMPKVPWGWIPLRNLREGGESLQFTARFALDYFPLVSLITNFSCTLWLGLVLSCICHLSGPGSWTVKKTVCFWGTNFVVAEETAPLSFEQITKVSLSRFGTCWWIIHATSNDTESPHRREWLVFLSHEGKKCFCRHFWYTCMLEAIRCEVFLTHVFSLHSPGWDFKVESSGYFGILCMIDTIFKWLH